MNPCTLRRIRRQGAPALAALAALLAPGPAARAQAPADPVAVTFTAPTNGQSVPVGSNVLFDASFNDSTFHGYQITDATFTSTDPVIGAEITSGQISAVFDGADGAGDPFVLLPGTTSVPGVFELDLDSALPPGQTISGSVGFDGFLLDGSNNPTGPSIEVASSSFRIVTAAPSPVPEAPLGGVFAVTCLGMMGLLLRARRRGASGASGL